MMSNNDTLAERLSKAGEATGDKVWRLPLHDHYDKQIDTDAADVKNIGNREAGSITAAQFLQRFVNKVPWAHLDIAGVDWREEATPTQPLGASGFSVRLLDRLARETSE